MVETAPLLEPLAIDLARATAEIEAAIRHQVFGQMKKKGVVVAVSGGIDSSVVAYLCARALGKDRVFALFLPEIDSASESLDLGRLVASNLGIDSAVEDIAPILRAAGCYRRRDDAIRLVMPEYGDGYKSKVVMSGALRGGFQVFSIVVQSPDGRESKIRLTAEAYLGIIAATNFKQRTRKMMEYYYADRLNYVVAGTPNRLEYDQGFFVKNGDGSADLKPIAHLYKTQVYQMAEYLGVPEEIRRRPPTTDTFSLAQSQEEFYYSLPYDKMDLCLWGKNHAVPAAELAPLAGFDAETVERVYKMIDAKRRATAYLHWAPLLAQPVTELK